MSGETLREPQDGLEPGEPGVVHLLFARAKEPVGVGMAKAILGQRVYRDDRLVLETARLRSRVRDLESVIEGLQSDNDRLRERTRERVGAVRESVH